jgi:DNA-binding CsgD family transcriptional regulator
MVDTLQHGRESYRRRAWADAYRSLSLADGTSELGVDDLELLWTSAYLVGRDLESERILERAHHAHVAAGDQAGAARSAFWLGLGLLLRGGTGPATGWLSRARRLLDGRDCVEQGYLLLPAVEQCLAEGRVERALDGAGRAAAIGVRFRDADLTALARHLQGRGLLEQTQIHSGLALLDEAMLAVTAGELSPIVTGLIYCSVIEACQRVYALGRAREWTAALSRWCDQQPAMVAFRGTCLVRRAEILQVQGAWPDALAEACRACESASADPHRKPPGAALYQQAEIHRLRGEFATAEEAYRTASGLGYEPQPGLALLRLAQGRTDAARAAICRVEGATTERLPRAKLLPAYVDIMLAAGAIQQARSACDELSALATSFDTDALRAVAWQGAGAVALAEGDARAALGSLRRAFECWQRIEAPHAAACVRVLMGAACRTLGDDETAGLEWGAARAVFEALGAAPDLARVDAIEARDASHRPPLTARELQVLRLVAAGQTNKGIATELSVSERTIDRHVGNILTKLDVPSRAGAVACAYRAKLL